MIPEKHLGELIHMAKQLGASDVGIILSADIEVNEDLAALCNGDHPCSNYGLSSSCPPHVQGPSRFQEWKNSSKYSIVARIDVPSVVMFSDERHEVMQLLHEIVAGIETLEDKSDTQSMTWVAGLILLDRM